MSVDCDCCAVAEDPCMQDIGILASKDPIAIDQACLDLVYAADDVGRDHLIERIESRNGVHTIESAAALGYGINSSPSGVKEIPLLVRRNSSTPISSSSSLIAADKLGWEMKRLLAASFMELAFATVMA